MIVVNKTRRLPTSCNVLSRSLSKLAVNLGITLRDYQLDAIAKVKGAISRGVRRQAVVLATGGGKTIVFSHLIPEISTAGRGNKTLVLAHKEELIFQAAKTIKEINSNLNVDIDMRKSKPRPDSDVIVASIPTLVRKTRLEWYNPKDFKLIILDECHHATASSWSKILKYFNADSPELEIYVLGFTATLERSDGRSLGTIFDEIVFNRGLLTMVQNGELADAKFSCVDIDVDLTKVATKKDDYEITSLSEAINTDKVNLLVAMSYIKLKEKYGFNSTLMFCVDIAHCKTLCGVLQRHGINAQYVTGDTAKHERASIINDFKNGVIQVLCNVMVFTEGTDIPNIDSLFLARPTKSRPLLVQMIGRGLRLHKGKKYCHIVDIAGTRGTGVQSVPTLFSLPADYEIRDKTFQDLSKEKEEYDIEQEKLKLQETIKKEKLRRLEEEATFLKTKQLGQLRTDLNLKFTTFDGFISLESESVTEFNNDQLVNKILRESSIDWVRLEYDSWGCQCANDKFFLLRRQTVNETDYHFVLSLNVFHSAREREVFKYSIPKYYQESELEKNSNLRTVCAKAESLISTISPVYRNFLHKSAITKKQADYLSRKMNTKLGHYYTKTPELETKLKSSIQKFDKDRASKLIFAFKFSLKSLWIRWELQRLLGPDNRTQRTVKKLVGKDGLSGLSSSAAHSFAANS